MGVVLSLPMLRVRSHKTKGQIAKELGVHPQTYAKYEYYPDLMTIGQAKLLARILNCEFEDIFFERELELKSRTKSKVEKLEEE